MKRVYADLNDRERRERAAGGCIVNPRPESALMSAGRKVDYDLHHMRPGDLFALCIGYALLIGVALFSLVTIGVALDDWANGRTVDVLSQVSALLARLD